MLTDFSIPNLSAEAVADWCWYPHMHRQTMVLKTFAWIWFVRPEWIGNPTQRALADRLGVSKQVMNKAINDLRRAFGWERRGMRSEAARAKMAEHARNRAPALAEKRRAAQSQRAKQQSIPETPL